MTSLGKFSRTVLKLNLKFDKLYLLHATGWGSPGVADGTGIGHFTIQYEDKTSATIPIEYGLDVRDWWALGDSDPVTRGEVAWKGVNEASKEFRGRRVEIRLFMTAWVNPQPGKKVTAFDYVSKNETMCSPFLIAVSAAPAADDRAAVEALKDAGAYLEFDETGRVKAVSLSGPGPRANANRGSDVMVLHLASLPTLEKAYLNSPGITDAGMEFLEGLTRLRWLSLNLSGVTDMGLARVKNLKNVERLRLHGTAVTDDGLLQLEKLMNLKVLDLSLTAVTDAGLPRLSHLSSLEELDLRNTNVTEAGISRLRASLQKTKISR